MSKCEYRKHIKTWEEFCIEFMYLMDGIGTMGNELYGTKGKVCVMLVHNGKPIKGI
jgi:hypothetical protein